MTKRILPFLGMLALSLSHPLYAATDRVALVIGNDAYQHARPLVNPNHDAKAVAEALRRLDFTVLEHTDVGLTGMRDALRDFVRQVPEKGTAMVFYAGHGVQIKGSNYLVPVDARMSEEYEVPDEALSMDMILRAMESTGSSLNLLVLDCCRDDPFSRSWRGSRSTQASGLGSVSDMPAGMFIAYATSPGKVAADGQGQHSPYTHALLHELSSRPDIPVEMLFKNVGRSVVQNTAGQQEPWTNSKFYGQFAFAAASSQISTQDTPPEALAPPQAATSSSMPPLGTPQVLILPARGFYDLSELFDGTAYDAYNAYSQKKILEKAQEFLKLEGFYTSTVDGDPGPGTQKAILEWQAAAKVPVTGKLDAASQVRLGLTGITQSTPPVSAPKPSVIRTSPSKPAATPAAPPTPPRSAGDLSEEEFLRRARALRNQ